MATWASAKTKSRLPPKNCLENGKPVPSQDTPLCGKRTDSSEDERCPRGHRTKPPDNGVRRPNNVQIHRKTTVRRANNGRIHSETTVHRVATGRNQPEVSDILARNTPFATKTGDLRTRSGIICRETRFEMLQASCARKEASLVGTGKCFVASRVCEKSDARPTW